MAEINIEEMPDKIVGKRRAITDAFKAGMALQEMANTLQKSFGHALMPKGVFRFHTHEEADEWMMKMLVRHSRKS